MQQPQQANIQQHPVVQQPAPIPGNPTASLEPVPQEPPAYNETEKENVNLTEHEEPTGEQ